MAECDAEKLISLVKERRAIYDFSMREHSNRRTLDKLWEEISEEMDVSAGDCKAKWANLRNSFSREMRERRKPSGSGTKKETDSIHEVSPTPTEPLEVESEAPKESLKPVSKKRRPSSPSASEGVAGPMINFLKSRAQPREPEDPDLNFFRSLFPDLKKLAPRMQRSFKGNVLTLLSELMDE